jgi:hypothetical protein
LAAATGLTKTNYQAGVSINVYGNPVQNLVGGSVRFAIDDAPKNNAV